MAKRKPKKKVRPKQLPGETRRQAANRRLQDAADLADVEAGRKALVEMEVAGEKPILWPKARDLLGKGSGGS